MRDVRRVAAAAALAALLAGCPSAEPEPEPTPAPALGPTADFDRFCDVPWEETVEDAQVPDLQGNYYGWFDLPAGTVHSQKVIPPQPFHVEEIRVRFAGPAGPYRVRLTTSLGRSYPDVDNPDADLVPPIEGTLDVVDPETYVNFDVREHDVFLLPPQHYHVVSERLEGGPGVVKETLGPDGSSQALMLVPGEFFPWSTDANFRMKLRGRFFCAWSDADRWFQPLAGPFGTGSAPHVTDVDGDGHEDLVLSGGPTVYLGDGAGGFTESTDGRFPEDVVAGTTFFADLDNDGDADAFTTTWAGPDDDGDGFDKSVDCHDGDAAIHPDAEEVAGNGRDDDCDGVADDGLDDQDADGDGVALSEGDCDDTLDVVHPDALEVGDNLDNDCDGTTDEATTNHVLLNDGAGYFTELEGSGVEVWDQSTGAGFGDANGDGALDVYWGNWLITYPDHPAHPDRYFEGNGDGTFTDAFEAAGLELTYPYSVYGVLWNDWNNDGHQDIYVSNYHLYPNQLWANQGDGTFVDVAEDVNAAFDGIESGHPLLTGGHSYGGDFGDFDNDGDMDLYVANLAHPREHPWSDPSQFLVNQGPPDYRFYPETEQRGFLYDEGDFNATFADFDHDMDLDLAIASIYPNHYSRLYRNDDGTFLDVTHEAGLQRHDTVSLVWADFDTDGDLDIVIEDAVFENTVGQDRSWVQLELEGTTSNRDALGARVTLTAGGDTQMRDVRGPGAHVNAQSSRVVHFGLADLDAVDSVTVRWVGGATETIEGVVPNQRLRVVEGSGVAEAP